MRIDVDEYLTVAKAAALLRVHQSTIRRWIDQGSLPAYRVGQRRLALKRADVDRLVRPVAAAGVAPDSAIGPVADNDLSTLTPRERAAVIAARRAEIPPLTAEQRERGSRAMAEARAIRDRMLRERGGVPFSESWEILNQLRDERSQQLS